MRTRLTFTLFKYEMGFPFNVLGLTILQQSHYIFELGTWVWAFKMFERAGFSCKYV